MENKINIANLLRDCPSGMELECLMYEDVYFDYVDECNIIHCYVQYKTYKTSIEFSQRGTTNNDIKSKCVIFPKGKNTWNGFHKPFNDGDIVATDTGNWIGITLGGMYSESMPVYCVIDNKNNLRLYFDKPKTWYFSRLATKAEKKKLFDAIEANGYHWNEETKSLEKLPKFKFKFGDIVQHKTVDMIGTITLIDNDERDYRVNLKNGGITYILFESQDDWELVPKKFDITTLKTFDKVLVRCSDNGSWNPQFFSRYRSNSKFPFECTYNSWSQCIPYEGNEYLSNTTNDCNDFFKIWE